jgi:hypothetical protein
MARNFRGEAGRPFGTVAALLCLIMTVAILVLGRVAFAITGTSSPIGPDPALLPVLQDFWGLFLASEIVRATAAILFLLAVWTLSHAIGPRTPRSRLALVAGTLAGLLLAGASRQGIIAAAHLGSREIVSHGELVSAIGAAGLASAGIWAVLTAVEARRAQSLPAWVQQIGFVLCAAAFASAVLPGLLPVLAGISLVWWGGLFATLYRPQDRLAR